MNSIKTRLFKKCLFSFLLSIYKITIGMYVRIRFFLVREGNVRLPKKGPFLLIGNHSNNFDGLFLQCLCPRLIHFVITDTVFRNKMLGRILRFLGYIPIRKHQSDGRSIRQIIRTLKSGGVVGIFPEGMRNWDGKTGPILNATCRLIQVLDVPIYAARIKGGYLSEPRWADKKRRGRVEVEFIKLFDAHKKMSLSSVEAAVTDALSHDEAIWQQEKHIPFKGRALCKGFERLLFICPACRAVGTMDSSNKRIWCRSCGAVFSLDVFGHFLSEDDPKYMKTAHELNMWQQNVLAEEFSQSSNHDILVQDHGAVLYAADTEETDFAVLTQGSAVLKRTQLRIGECCFETSSITGLSVYFKSHLDFKHSGKDYRVGFEHKRISAYKWHCALSLLQNQKHGGT